MRAYLKKAVWLLHEPSPTASGGRFTINSLGQLGKDNFVPSGSNQSLDKRVRPYQVKASSSSICRGSFKKT